MEITLTQIKINFATELFLRHFEEASFLYEQRISLFDDPEITWLDIEDFEERFEAHIDGLVVGEDLALEVCKQQAEEGDFGELHAAVRVFCRQKQHDLLLEILINMDTDDEEAVKAISDALNHELPDKWQNEFIRILKKNLTALSPIIARMIGYRRIKAGDELLKAIERVDEDMVPDFIWALGRLNEIEANHILFNKYLRHEDENICSAAALSLLRIGEPQVIQYCTGIADSKDWTYILLGLGGRYSSVSVLKRQVLNGQATPDCVLALGLLGDISGVDLLLKKLGDPELAESAAIGLNLITGAELYEEYFIPEEIDEDELFEEELEKLKRGESLYPEGEQPGTTINRLSQNQEDWIKWWEDNKSKFNPEIRYRNGKPYSPLCLLENMKSEKSVRKVRELAYEEFVIRYGIDFPFETDMLVSQQKETLQKYENWINENGNKFKPGKWYFAGNII